MARLALLKLAVGDGPSTPSPDNQLCSLFGALLKADSSLLWMVSKVSFEGAVLCVNLCGLGAASGKGGLNTVGCRKTIRLLRISRDDRVKPGSSK